MTSSGTAVILLCVQNDVFSPNGVLFKTFPDATEVLTARAQIVHLVRSLVKSDALILSLPFYFQGSYESLEPIDSLKIIREHRAFRPGLEGADLIFEFAEFSDRILEIPGKTGADAFQGTDLEAVLKENDVGRIVLAGCSTATCVLQSAQHGSRLGFDVTVLSDCVVPRGLDREQALFENQFEGSAHVMSSNEFLKLPRPTS